MNRSPAVSLAQRYPLPPFGREVRDALAAGRRPNVCIYACKNPWPRALQRRKNFGIGSVLLLPEREDPSAFSWPPLADVIVNITGLAGETVRALARALVRDGVRLAYLLDAERPERDLRVVARNSDLRRAA